MAIPVERQHRRLANSQRTLAGTDQQVTDQQVRWSALSTLGGNSNRIGLCGEQLTKGMLNATKEKLRERGLTFYISRTGRAFSHVFFCLVDRKKTGSIVEWDVQNSRIEDGQLVVL